MRLPDGITINLITFFAIPLALWLGVTGKVDWWVLIMIWVSHLCIALTFEKRR